ncbi:MAG: hypothetical protein ACE5FN_10785 [Leptospirillia bacterium]
MPINAPCPLCGETLSLDGQPTRKEICPSCNRELHVCLACRFHDPTAHNECRESRAEWQARRDRANFCDLFELSTDGPDPEDSAKEQKRQSQLDDLFKNF